MQVSLESLYRRWAPCTYFLNFTNKGYWKNKTHILTPLVYEKVLLEENLQRPNFTYTYKFIKNTPFFPLPSTNPWFVKAAGHRLSYFANPEIQITSTRSERKEKLILYLSLLLKQAFDQNKVFEKLANPNYEKYFLVVNFNVVLSCSRRHKFLVRAQFLPLGLFKMDSKYTEKDFDDICYNFLTDALILVFPLIALYRDSDLICCEIMLSLRDYEGNEEKKFVKDIRNTPERDNSALYPNWEYHQKELKKFMDAYLDIPEQKETLLKEIFAYFVAPMPILSSSSIIRAYFYLMPPQHLAMLTILDDNINSFPVELHHRAGELYIDKQVVGKLRKVDVIEKDLKNYLSTKNKKFANKVVDITKKTLKSHSLSLTDKEFVDNWLLIAQDLKFKITETLKANYFNLNKVVYDIKHTGAFTWVVFNLYFICDPDFTPFSKSEEINWDEHYSTVFFEPTVLLQSRYYSPIEIREEVDKFIEDAKPHIEEIIAKTLPYPCYIKSDLYLFAAMAPKVKVLGLELPRSLSQKYYKILDNFKLALVEGSYNIGSNF